MDEQMQHLLDRVWALYGASPRDKRVLIGISGIPGSGEGTLF